MANEQRNEINHEQQNERTKREVDHLECKQGQIAKREGDCRPERDPPGRLEEIRS